MTFTIVVVMDRVSGMAKEDINNNSSYNLVLDVNELFDHIHVLCESLESVRGMPMILPKKFWEYPTKWPLFFL